MYVGEAWWRVIQVGNRVFEVRDKGSLIDGRQETGGPEGRALRGLRRADDDKAGQVLVFSPQAVSKPGAKAGP